MSYRSLILKMLFLTLLTFTGQTLAMDDSLEDTPTPYLIYRAILGGIVDLASFNPPSVPVDGVLSSMFLVFNLSVFTVLTYYIFVVLIQKVVESGNSGRLESQKYNDTMSVMRATMSLCGILPVIKGFCVAQVVVIFMGVQASFIADEVNKAGNEKAFLQGGLTSYSPSTEKMEELAYKITGSVVCAAAMQNYYSSHPALDTLYSISLVDKSAEYADSESSSFHYQYENSLGIPICGSYSMRIDDDKYLGSYGDPTGTFGEMSVTQKAIRERIVQSHKKAILNTHNTVSSALSSGIFIPGEPIDVASIFNAYNNVINSYSNGLQSAYAESSEQMKSEWERRFNNIDDESLSIYSAQRGWIYNGATWMEKSRTENFLSKISYSYPTATLPLHSEMDVAFIEDAFSPAQTKAINAVNDKELESQNSNNKDNRSLIDAIVEDGSVENAISIASNFVVNTLLVDTQFNFKDYDPLTNLQHFGHRLIVSGFTILTLAVTTEVAMETVAGEETKNSIMRKAANLLTLGGSEHLIAGSKALAGNILAFLFSLAPLLIAVGTVLAYWLPSLPMFMWDLAVLGNYLLVLVAFCAAPLWAAANAGPSGDGFSSDNAKQGFLTIITILARPSIMVITWNISIVLMKEMGYYVSLFLNYAPSINEGTTQILWGSLMMVFIMLIFEIIIIHRCISLVYEVPDQMPVYYGSSNTTAHENIGDSKAQSIIAGWQSQAQNTTKESFARDKK